MLNIAIIHYHLKPGGVTRVIENAVESLRPHDANIVVLSGDDYHGDCSFKTAKIPLLAYSKPGVDTDAKELTNALKAEAAKALGAEPDLWHIHNHSLGKNGAMTEVIAMLAQEEAALLLQIHDFAEDGRPENYKLLTQQQSTTTHPYPIASQIHYAVLNNRDFKHLSQAGIPAENLHLLANTVAVPTIPEKLKPAPELEAERLIIYPTRAIRRKNIGELALWAACAEDGELYASTLSPANPSALPIHQRWVEFSKELQLPVKFAIGETLDIPFFNLLAMADQVISTSVAEGFGLAFLEPWLYNKPLIGRNISDITSDFTQQGIQLDHLYHRLDVPLELIGATLLKRELQTAMQGFYDTYDTVMPKSAVEEAFGSMVKDNSVDFGRLDEHLQEQVIRKIVDSPELKKMLRPSQPQSPSSQTIEANAKSIKENFNLKAYGIKLFQLYQLARSSSHEKTLQQLPDENVLKQFLSPARFNLLRT